MLALNTSYITYPSSVWTRPVFGNHHILTFIPRLLSFGFLARRLLRRDHSLCPPRCADRGGVPFSVPTQVREIRHVEKPPEDVGIDQLVDHGLCCDAVCLF